MEKIDFYNKKKSEYKKQDNETEIRYQRALELAAIKSDSKILDIGCKYAYLRYLLSQKKIKTEYYGIDLLEDVLKEIDGYAPDYFKACDVSEGIPFPDNTFDYIIALEVLEHLESPTIMLKEVNRVLRNDGEFIISIPNPYCFWELQANLRKKPDTEGHIASFTHQNISRLLEFIGMKIIDYCGTTMRVPFSRRLLKIFLNNNSYLIFKTDCIFLSRSFIYKTVKKEDLKKFR